MWEGFSEMKEVNGFEILLGMLFMFFLIVGMGVALGMVLKIALWIIH